MTGDDVYLRHMGVDLVTVWGITQRDLPPLKEKIEALSELPGS